MRYGHFDNTNKEYVIERVDIPVSWTNYIGTGDMCGVFNHTAGGYIFCGSPEYHRITRFRPNGVPMDFPGHYVYLRDDQSGDYWTISWQPAGKQLDRADYQCRHGLSYSVYSCYYADIRASQKLFVSMDDPVEIWDVTIRNDSSAVRNLSVFSYLEFSFHHIDMDNRNFQMSLYAAGSRYKDGIIEHDLHYEENGYQFFTSNFIPDGFDCLRDSFIGPYRTERNPIAVENGCCSSSFEKGGNHCGSLQKKITLQPGEEVRLIYLLGEGGIESGRKMREKYGDPREVDRQFAQLKTFWEEKCAKLQINTPDAGMNTLINIWTLYQSEINVMFSRFSSFIEVGGRTGLGYRDTAQDAMSIPHSNPQKCKSRIVELLRALTTQGYGIHLFEPAWFETEKKQQSFKSPTVIPVPDKSSIVHGLKDVCADDALWLIGAIVNFIKETGETDFLWENISFADGGSGTVYDHMRRILDFSSAQVGRNGICKGLRADWNDCLNLGGGESAMVSFLHHWALVQFTEVACFVRKTADADYYKRMAEMVRQTCEEVLWDDGWYIRGITADGKKIGSHQDKEGRVHLESNAWAVLSGAASPERGRQCMEAVKEYLYTEYGLMLNAPPFTVPDDSIGFVTRVYPGLKENGAIFSHPNPWAWAAMCMLGSGADAKLFYDALSPYNQNDKIEVRQSEPYSYCQFVVGRAHTAFGRARHPFMTGTAGWAYFAVTQYMLGIKPGFDSMTVDPCIPSDWKEFSINRVWRGAEYRIHVTNPNGVERGVKSVRCDGELRESIPVYPSGSIIEVDITMG
jgi:N,N'-diacetylchitobiose phosphorylase